MCIFANLSSEITARCEQSVAVINQEKLVELKGYGFNIVHKKENYIILKKHKSNQVIIWNYIKPYKKGNVKYHTHLRSLHVAKSIVDNILNQVMPGSQTKWILMSYYRISDENYKYKKQVEKLIYTKNNKTKVHYRKEPRNFRR